MSRRLLRTSLATLVVGAILPSAAAQADRDFGLSHRPVCPSAAPGFARCNSDVVTDANGKPAANPTPSGYGPPDLINAYNLATAGSGAGQTIAIVDAFDDPNAASDLTIYRSKFGLPACGTGCFRKVDQNGGTSYPRSDGGWSQEISLDLDMASAICPSCQILLVEAASNSFANLSAAVDRAWLMGANVISNSYGGSEYSSEVSDQSHYDHAGVPITVSTGDSGYGAEFPATATGVTAVGGTTLRRANNSRGWSETAWSGAGSGCSKYIAKPKWQNDGGCANRTVADVSAVADPNTGVAVYDTFRTGGWLVFGGTSVSAPIVAAVYARAANASTFTGASSVWSNYGSLNDVTSGSNGACSVAYLCNAGSGFDGPTGWGTPNGTGAF